MSSILLGNMKKKMLQRVLEESIEVYTLDFMNLHRQYDGEKLVFGY